MSQMVTAESFGHGYPMWLQTQTKVRSQNFGHSSFNFLVVTWDTLLVLRNSAIKMLTPQLFFI